MNSRVHFWVVCDAVDFIKNHGDGADKKALQTLQIAYGENRPVEDIPIGRTAVEYLAGFESWHTDKFRDLAIELPTFPFNRKRSLTGFGGRVFSAFDHFINPFPQEENTWSGAEGYTYGLSSKRGLDSLIMRGTSEYLHGRIDIENSPVLERLRPFWEREGGEWDSHFAREVQHVKFASWTALINFYYSKLILDHFDPLEVRGPNSHIVGLQILGPVLHAIVDSCSIQHVRPALGFGHPIWENYVQSRIYNREIALDPTMVRSFLMEEPFAPSRTKTSGLMQGRFDVEAFVYEMSIRTVNRMQWSTGSSWQQILHADTGFWWKYLSGPRMMDDVRYIYNQAVAGTVHAIVRCCEDLTAVGILEPGRGLSNPEKMPPIQLTQDGLRTLPTKKQSPDGVPSESFRPAPFSSAVDLLGFAPVRETDLTRRMEDATVLFSGPNSRQRRVDDVKRVLDGIESSLAVQYEAKAREIGPRFCPLSYLENLPVESDLSAHFGTATFRLPSTAECNDTHLMQRYMDQAASHELLAEKLQLTQLVAAFCFYRDQRSSEPEAVSELNSLIEGLRELRDTGPYQKQDVPAVSLETSFETTPDAQRGMQETGESEGRPDLTTTAARIGSGIFNLPLAALAGLSSLANGLLYLLQELTAPLMRVPVAVLATAAAVILVVVLVYPPGAPQPYIGLSSEEWPPGIKLMAPKAPVAKAPPLKPAPKARVAMIIQFQGFEKPPEQSLVDSLYQALTPSGKWKKEFDFLAPAKLKYAVAEGAIKAETTAELLEGLRSKLNVAQAIVLTIEKSKDHFDVTAEMKDLSTGKASGIDIRKNLNEDELPKGVRDSATRLLSPTDQESDSGSKNNR